MELVKDLLRNLVSTNKNMRLYPDGNQLIMMSSTTLLRLMNTLFEETETFTFSESKNALNINTTPLDSKTYGGAVDEFLGLLKEHYIKSVTFRKGVTEQEVERFLRNLDKSPDKPFATKGYWNQFLDDIGIINIGVTQRAFIATKEKTISATVPTTPEKIEFTSEIASAIRDFLRYFCAAVENIKLYPPGSQLVTEALKYVTKSMEKVFTHIQALNLASSEGILLVNGTPGHSRLLGSSVITLVNLIRSYVLKSISFIKGVSKEELESFIEVFSTIPVEEAKSKKSKEWEDILTQKGIVNIKIGLISYVTADARGKGVAKLAAEALSELPPSALKKPPITTTETLIITFADIMKGLSDRLLEDTSLRIAERLIKSNDFDKFEEFYQKFLQNFRSRRAEIRAQSNTAYQKLLKQLNPQQQSFLMEKTFNILVEELRAEKTPVVYNGLFTSATKHVVYYLENKQYNSLKRIVITLLSQSPDKELSKDAPHKLYNVLRENAAFAEFLKGIFDTDANIRNTIKEIIILFNQLVAPDLIELIKNTDDLSLRENTALLISQLPPEAHQFFIDELKNNTDVSIIKRLLSVSYLIPREEIAGIIASFIKNPFYKEALYSVSRLEKNKTLSILLPLLNTKDSKIILEVLSILEVLKYPESVDAVIKTIQESTDTEIQKNASDVLVKLQEQRAVPIFIKLLSTRRFLGLVGGVSDEVRAKAAWALGQIKTDEAQKALTLVLNDKSPTVRSVAKLSLKNYE
jgi:HEAT repeat protein